MALKITAASEPITVEHLRLVIYGQPGAGKTSLACTASRPLLLDFDRGAHRAVSRCDTVQIGSWSDVEAITADDLAPYDTVIADTAGRLAEVLTADIIRRNAKHGNGGALSQQGWGQLKVRFAAFTALLATSGVDLVIVSHMAEKQDGEITKQRLDVPGSSAAEIVKSADAIGRLTIKDGAGFLDFNPTEHGFGKNPARIEPQRVPLSDAPEFGGFLAGVIAETKAKLNADSEAQREVREEHEWFVAHLPKITDAAGMNEIGPRAKAAGPAVLALMKDRAKELGLRTEKGVAGYLDPEPPVDLPPGFAPEEEAA